MTLLPTRGVLACPVLPMNSNHDVDWTTLATYLSHVVSQRPAAIAMNMDASEGPSLERDEQLKILDASREAIGNDMPLISGLQAVSTRDAVQWGRELKSAGADGLAIFLPMPMFQGAPVPEDMVYGFHAELADSVDLPLILFQYPFGLGPDFTPSLLRRLAAHPNIVGIKEASFDVPRTAGTISAAHQLGRDFGVFSGSDTVLFEALMMGCDGALVGLAAVGTDRVVALQCAVAEQRYADAKEIWDRIGPLARHCWSAPWRDYRPRLKEVLKLQGILPHAACRPPQPAVSEAEIEILRRLAIHAGLVAA